YFTQLQHRAVAVRAQHDVAELIRRLQAALSRDGRVDLLSGYGRRGTERTHGDLLVLRLHRAHDIGRGEPVDLQLVRVEPDAHRVLRTEYLDVADALDAADRVHDVGGHVIGDVVARHAAIVRDEADDHQEPGVRL